MGRGSTVVLAVRAGDGTDEHMIVAVRYQPVLIRVADVLSGMEAQFGTLYTLLGAETISAQVALPDLVDRVNILARRLIDRQHHGEYHLLIDATAAGQATLDLLKRRIDGRIHITSVELSDDDRPDRAILWRNSSRAGIHYLAGRLRLIIEDGRLQVPPAFAALVEQSATLDPAEAPASGARILALACAGEFQPVRYDVSPDELPAPNY